MPSILNIDLPNYHISNRLPVKRYYFIFLILFLSAPGYAVSFLGLSKHEYKFKPVTSKNEDEKCFLTINDKKFSAINKTLGTLKADHPLHMPEDANSSDDILLGIVELNENSEKYYLVLSWGPSYDLGYYFYEEKRVSSYVPEPDKYINYDFFIEANSLIIPGNGEIYAYGHNDNLFNVKKKFIYKDKALSEVKQDFYFSGAKSVSLKNQTAFTNKYLKDIAFEIEKGEAVTIIGLYSENRAESPGLYLVASNFGLTGYVKVDPSQHENQFKGFFYSGD